MKRILLVVTSILLLLSVCGPVFHVGKVANAASFGSVTKIITFAKSTGQSCSKTITIPNLGEVNRISVNTGTVSYTTSGDHLTVQVRGGEWVSRDTYTDPHKYSKTVAQSRTNNKNSFPNSIGYSDGAGYSGTLTKSGSSKVISGSYTPEQTKNVTEKTSVNREDYFKYLGGGSWTTYSYTSPPLTTPTASKTYSKSGYKGTLKKSYINMTNERHIDPSHPQKGKYYARYSYTSHYEYSGTVTKPAVDTRVWQQNYSGTVYKAGKSYRNYQYAYTVTVTYTLNHQLDAQVLHTQKWADKLNVSRSNSNFRAGENFVVMAQTSNDATKVVAIPPNLIENRINLNPNADHTQWTASVRGKEKTPEGSYDWAIRATYQDGNTVERKVTITINGQIDANIHLTQ